jgi:hypothetical protein
MKYLEYNEAQLMYAAAGTNVSAVRWYLSQGASADTFDENRSSPLHVACRSGSFQVVEELVNISASVNIADCGGWTCLHVASYNGRPHIVSMLLKKGADATLVNRKGETPWDIATDESTQHIFMLHWKDSEREYQSEANSFRDSSPNKRTDYFAVNDELESFQERRSAHELAILEKQEQADSQSKSRLGDTGGLGCFLPDEARWVCKDNLCWEGKSGDGVLTTRAARLVESHALQRHLKSYKRQHNL